MHYHTGWQLLDFSGGTEILECTCKSATSLDSRPLDVALNIVRLSRVRGVISIHLVLGAINENVAPLLTCDEGRHRPELSMHVHAHIVDMRKTHAIAASPTYLPRRALPLVGMASILKEGYLRTQMDIMGSRTDTQGTYINKNTHS